MTTMLKDKIPSYIEIKNNDLLDGLSYEILINDNKMVLDLDREKGTIPINNYNELDIGNIVDSYSLGYFVLFPLQVLVLVFALLLFLLLFLFMSLSSLIHCFCSVDLDY